MIIIPYLSCSYASWIIYFLMSAFMFYLAVKYPNKIRTLGLALLASLVTYITLTELPKSIITNHIAEAKGIEYKQSWKWVSTTETVDTATWLQWWLETCSYISGNGLIIILSITITIIWIIFTQYLLDWWNVPHPKVVIPKKTYKTLWISFLACVALFTVGVLTAIFCFIAFLWVVKKFI